jgi:hypothetical protein
MHQNECIPRSTVFVSITGISVALLFIVVSITCFVAEIRHNRYVLSEGRRSVRGCIPIRIALPCRAEQEHVYVCAAKWIDDCARDGVVTWLIRESCDASITHGALYPWSARMCFAYASPKLCVPADACVHATRWKKAELPVLEPCSIGILERTMRRPQPLHAPRRMRVIVPRRDVLDCFRVPMQRHDTFDTYV